MDISTDFNDQRYRDFDCSGMPVAALAEDCPNGYDSPRHQHPSAQLIYAVRGVMVVSTAEGQWIVPPSRGLWMPSDTLHSIRMVGEVKMRTAFIDSTMTSSMPQCCAVLKISSLLRELILALIDIPIPYELDSKGGRMARLHLDEVQGMGTLPLHLSMPNDVRLLQICNTIRTDPGDNTTVAQWATRLHIDAKTIHRHFLRETGLTFGQWRTQARLVFALERLAAGEKVLNIALDLGYESPSAFTTMFKKQFGISPSHFFA